MKKALLIAALSVCASVPAMAADAQGWGYMGDGAPHKWGGLDPAFEACKSGVAQSPINIDQYLQVAMPIFDGAYKPSPLQVVNSGRTVQVNYAPGSGFSANGKAFELVQIHFHTPGEHYIDGAPYPLEAHFVHKSEDGLLGIVAVMFKVGAANPSIEGIWQNVPVAGTVKAVRGVEIDASNLMPEDKSYYAYDGSLSEPPCSEGVKWFVMEEPIELSAVQLRAFQAVFPVNARPIQPLGGRVVRGN